MPSNQQSNPNLSPAQADFVYWLSGLAPVATNIVTPLMVYWTMRGKPGTTNLQRYNQQVNEVVRQFVSGTIGLISYFGGGELTRGLLKGLVRPDGSTKAPMDESTKHVAMILGGVAMSFIGFAFVRPKISTDLICALLKKADNSSNLVSHNKLRKMVTKLTEQSGNGHFSQERFFQELDHLKKKPYLSMAEAKAMTLGVSNDKNLITKSGFLAALDQREGKNQAVRKAAPPSGVVAKFRQSVKNKLEVAKTHVEDYLIPNGEPSAERTAIAATVFLTGYLSSLTAILWSINRLLGKDSKTNNSKLVTISTHPSAAQLNADNGPGFSGYRPSSYAMFPATDPYLGMQKPVQFQNSAQLVSVSGPSRI